MLGDEIENPDGPFLKGSHEGVGMEIFHSEEVSLPYSGDQQSHREIDEGGDVEEDCGAQREDHAEDAGGDGVDGFNEGKSRSELSGRSEVEILPLPNLLLFISAKEVVAPVSHASHDIENLWIQYAHSHQHPL